MNQPSPLPSHAISVRGLSKRYRGAKKWALDHIDLDIARGTIFALLGPNGAGKSTLINILARLVIKSAGEARIWDIDIDRDPRGAAAAIGVVPQELNIDPFFTPRMLLELQAGLYGVPRRERQTEELLAALSLTDKAESYARTLSGGMRRRLMVAKALVHRPPVLVLDEPTAGVDVELRQQLWSYVRELNRQGVTILLTTHYLEEAEKLCDWIAIIDHGKLVASETKSAMLARLDRKEIIVTLSQDEGITLPSLPETEWIRSNAQQWRLLYRPSRTKIGELLSMLAPLGSHIQDISTRDTELEDVFLRLTQRGQ
ncbi:MAG TPA: ABC transporter ATP-binding protein [Dongiaceae bacterium]|nr:ABC transporter ATP-binding protein [Dongiaceae bacterium]